MTRAGGWLALAVASLLLAGWSEVVHARASRKRLGCRPGDSASSEVIVALGLRNRGRRANWLNRYRVRVALRSLSIDASTSRLVFSGGPASSGALPEAEVMFEYARRLGVPAAMIEVEVASRTTWENVRNVIPMLEGAERIVFASNALHAEKARAYLWRQRPDLAARLGRADDYRLGELQPVTPVLAWIGIRDLRRLGRQGG
ncbi:YdcF family protein [Amnibacterium kyonggiense]